MIASQLPAASALAALALALIAPGAAAQASKAPASKAEASKAQAAKPQAAGAQSPVRRTPITHFGTDAAIELRGDKATATFDFGNRMDELVTRARLHLRYSYSPALAPGLSKVRILLNDEEVGTLPVTAADADTSLARVLEIDPRLVGGSNRVTLVLDAMPGPVPADDARPGLWVEVSGASELEIAYQPLAVADDLAALPEPFFDRRDQRRVVIPFAFSAHPSKTTLNAAAVIASWFGQLAVWRGTRFPASLEIAPEGHAIAFAANNDRPAFLAALAPATGPELRMMANPGDGRSRLLVVMGRDGNDLRAAAEALVNGAKLTGAAARVEAPPPSAPRVPYDAPTFARLDAPVKLAQLIAWPGQLETAGKPPDLPPVRIELRVPPDLATWRGPGVPLDLQVQYTPNACVADSHLEVSIDDEPFYTGALRAGTQTVVERHEAFIPPYRLRGRMLLEVAFRFVPVDSARCREVPPPIKASVSPESTIDLSGFPHYVRLPNLEHFAAVGFPFTRYADLSQTVVVMPDRLVASDIEAMLGLMGRMGEATGTPATRVRVASASDEAALADADLLLVGASPQQGLLVKWAGELPVSVTGFARRSQQPLDRRPSMREWLGISAPAREPPPVPINFEGGGLVAAMFGFESPVTPGRSVVAVTAVSAHQVPSVLDALDDENQRRAVRGNAAFVLPGKVESVLVGKTYGVGFLPPWTGAGYWLQRHPNVVAALAFVGLALLATLAWFGKQQLDAWRARRTA